MKKVTVGQVTDLGGVDDKSFNASAWKGVQDAITQLGVDGKYLESKDQSDYAKNIQQYLSEKANLIVTIGFLLGVRHCHGGQGKPERELCHRGLHVPGLLSRRCGRQGLRFRNGTAECAGIGVPD